MSHSVQSVVRLAGNGYVCPSCVLQRHITASTRRSSGRALHLNSRRPQQPRSLSGVDVSVQIRIQTEHHALQEKRAITLASSTAINAPAYTPSRYKDVHNSFTRLQDDAAAFVDLSRIQLTLKSFESDSPRVRVGFLTLGTKGAIAARNLARVLLSDALGAEEAWEQALADAGVDGRSVLLRYGAPDDLTQSNAVMRVISIPSLYLHKHKLEILITPFRTNLTSTTPEDVEDALLVPSLTIPASAGRVGFVRSPVHKSVVISAGIDGAVQLGKLPSLGDSPLVRTVVDIAARRGCESGSSAATVDTALALEALQSFRKDLASGGSYGEKWLASCVPTLSAWLTNTLETDKPIDTVVEYASSTLALIEQAVEKASLDEAEKTQLSTIPGAVRERLQAAITEWSAQAHNDLRNNLITALDSRAWRRTAWFRLLWRIDDVSYSSTDIINQCWLNETEQSLAFLSGRIREAGLASDEELKENGSSMKLVTSNMRGELAATEHSQQGELTVAELVQLPTMLSRVHEQSGIDPLFDPPWPQTINLSRQAMLHTNVPEMHRKAQSLVLSTLSTIGGSSALSVWLWVATSGVALYEAGAVAALGLVWSLRRLQRLWGKERDGFSTIVQENGRTVLVEIESHLRRLVKDGGRTTSPTTDTDTFERARIALERCRQALAALKQP